MDIITFVRSISKIALIAFLTTFFLILYEVIMLLRSNRKDRKPVIPDYKGNIAYHKPHVEKKLKLNKTPFNFKTVSHRPLIIIFVVIVISLLVVGLAVLIPINFGRDAEFKKAVQRAVIKYVSSPGISIYDANWKKINDSQLHLLRSGRIIYIGVTTITGVQIEKARIRINANEWSNSDETDVFKKELQLFYREYYISTDAAELKIEAQLYEQGQGWLSR